MGFSGSRIVSCAEIFPLCIRGISQQLQYFHQLVVKLPVHSATCWTSKNGFGSCMRKNKQPVFVCTITCRRTATRGWNGHISTLRVQWPAWGPFSNYVTPFWVALAPLFPLVTDCHIQLTPPIIKSRDPPTAVEKYETTEMRQKCAKCYYFSTLNSVTMHVFCNWTVR